MAKAASSTTTKPGEKPARSRKVPTPPRIIFLDKDIPTALLGVNTGVEIEVVGSDGSAMSDLKARYYKSLHAFVISKIS